MEIHIQYIFIQWNCIDLDQFFFYRFEMRKNDGT